jgi:hypothetical protein
MVRFNTSKALILADLTAKMLIATCLGVSSTDVTIGIATRIPNSYRPARAATGSCLTTPTPGEGCERGWSAPRPSGFSAGRCRTPQRRDVGHHRHHAAHHENDVSGDILAREANYWHMIPMYFHPLRYPASDDGMATEGRRPGRHSRATRSVGSIHPWAYDAEGEVLSPRQLAAERTSGDPSGGSSIITLPRWPCSLAGA